MIDDEIDYAKVEAKIEEVTKKRTEKLRQLLAFVDEKEKQIEHLLDTPVELMQHLLAKKRTTLPNIVNKEFDKFFSRNEFNFQMLSEFMRYELDSFGTAGSELGKAYIDLERSKHEQLANIPVIGSKNISDERFDKLISTEWGKRLENNTIDDVQGWKDWCVARTMAHYTNRVRYCVQNNIDYANILREHDPNLFNIKGEGYFIKPSFGACSWCMFIASKGFQYRAHEKGEINKLHGTSAPACHCVVVYSTHDKLKHNKDYEENIKISKYYKEHISDVYSGKQYNAKFREKIFKENVANGEFTKHTEIKSSSINPKKVRFKEAFTIGGKEFTGKVYDDFCKQLLEKPRNELDFSNFKPITIETEVGEVTLSKDVLNHVFYGDVKHDGAKYKGRHFIEMNENDSTPFVTLERYIKTTKFKSRDIKTYFPVYLTKEKILDDIVSSFPKIKLSKNDFIVVDKGKNIQIGNYNFLFNKDNQTGKVRLETIFYKNTAEDVILLQKPPFRE